MNERTNEWMNEGSFFVINLPSCVTTTIYYTYHMDGGNVELMSGNVVR